MDCPNCGTYNPEDRTVCWRCDKELPKPQPEKKKNPQKTAQTWLYVLIGFFVLITVLRMLGFNIPFGPQMSSQEPTGMILRNVPLASWAISALALL